MSTFKRSQCGLAIVLFCSFPAAALAQSFITSATDQIKSILSLGSGNSTDKVSYVREQILKESAVALGARAGLSDRSRELMALLDSRAQALDTRYNFNPLVIGSSVLPPVISESKDVVALEAAAMRVAGAVFKIDEPARFAMPTPTWRDWLYVGLDAGAVTAPVLGANGPVGSAEQELWKRLVTQSYEQGKSQAQDVFDSNLALLERVHGGMQRYYDLWRRGMVSAPIIASNTDLVVREDANTIAVGNTLYRITAPTDFRDHQQWIPLE